MNSFRWGVVAPVVFCFSQIAAAQAPAGEIRVEVKDSSGAAMVASGKLTGVGSNRSFQTDERGGYTFSNLPFGRYVLEVSKTGFATQSIDFEVQSAMPISRVVNLDVSVAATRIEVVATTPLGGVDLQRDQIPAPVQTASDLNLQQSGALDLSDFLNRRLDGVHVNEVQGNPFQPDVTIAAIPLRPFWARRRAYRFTWTESGSISRSAT